MLFKTKKNNPDIIVFAKCPSCFQLIKMKSFTDAVLKGAQDCPFCHAFIEKKKIVSSCELYLNTTKALQFAGRTGNLDWAVVAIFALVFAVVTRTYLSRDAESFLFWFTIVVSSLMLIGGFLAIQNWLAVFSLARTADPDFIALREKLRRSRLIWLAANIFNLIVWFILIKNL